MGKPKDKKKPTPPPPPSPKEVPRVEKNEKGKAWFG
jgi:hypothetical protein